MAGAVNRDGVRQERSAGPPEVLVLTLDRTDRANAIDGTMAARLYAGLLAASSEPEVAAVVLTGTGNQAFSAGVALTNPDGLDPGALARQRAAVLTALLDPVMAFRKPLVVALNGMAAGAGAVLALLADAVVVADHAGIVFPRIEPGMPASVGLAALGGGALATELVLSGRPVGAVEMVERDMARCVTGPEVLPPALEAARRLARADRAGFARDKAMRHQARAAAMAVALREATERLRRGAAV